MKHFCQYCFFITLLLVFNGKTYATQNTLGCAINSEYQSFGSLPSFNDNKKPLIGYFCEFLPKRSTFLGNWFPTLPQVSFSKSEQLLINDDSSEADDYNQSWYIDLAIKRLGDSQLVMHAKHSKWQHTLSANEATSFYSRSASTAQDVITIQKDQQARLSYTLKAIGASLVFPYRLHQPLTRLTLQRLIITQAIQANIEGFPDNSLYNTETDLIEIGIDSHSYNKGLNINWGIALAAGSIDIDSAAISQNDDDLNEILSLYGGLELHYQYKINQRWFVFSRWQSKVRYSQQGKPDKLKYELGEVYKVTHALKLGLGLRF